jgi:hypothetical protein
MRTVLLGSDFMYDTNGNLKPIEINTAVGWDGPEKVEEDVDCLDLTNLYQFVEDNSFQNIHYIGDIGPLHVALAEHYSGSTVTYEFHGVGSTSITIPYIEDNETTLIIRSAYDTTALVDDTYCRDKIEFMNLIKDSSFGSQFVYMNDDNTLVSNITNINDNGVHPNFILKSRFPGYDKMVYPKFFKVTTQSELDTIIANNVTTDYFLMEFLYNPNKLWEGHSTVIRSLNILFPPNLESIQIGQYTKLNQNMLLDNVTYDPTTFEVNSEFKESYSTNPPVGSQPKLLDTDMVEMADGTLKTALDLQIGDTIKTIQIPNENGTTSIDNYISSDFGLTYETLSTNAVYTTNVVTNKQKVNTLTFINELTFEDGSTWEDTMGSRYLIERDGTVMFKSLFYLLPGDVVLLLDTTDDNINFTRKTVSSNNQVKRVFSGWFITVETAMLFLTKTSGSSNNESFVSIEHNLFSCPSWTCVNACWYPCPSCPKNMSCTGSWGNNYCYPLC